MASPTLKHHPLWALGFRPFFLFGSISALGLMSLWIAFFMGHISLPYSQTVLWHAHEMLFGFVGAIIIGFLLTSTQNWTGLPGLKNNPLKYLTLLWILGRALPFLGVPPMLSAGIDLAFFPASLWALSPHLLHPKHKRHRIFFILIALLFSSNVMVQLALVDLNTTLAPYGIRLATGVILMIVTIITGRVIPFFHSRAVAGSTLTKYPMVEKGIVLGSGLFFAGYVFIPQSVVLQGLAFLLACLHLFRWCYWHPERTLKVPILAVLYSGYLWLILGFIFFALSTYFALNPFLGLHAWTVGAMGVLIYGMVTRVSLGHTGRPLKASAFLTAGYVLMNMAAFVRVVLPVFLPTFYSQWVIYSGICWGLAFIFLLKELTFILLSPRPDGKIG